MPRTTRKSSAGYKDCTFQKASEGNKKAVMGVTLENTPSTWQRRLQQVQSAGNVATLNRVILPQLEGLCPWLSLTN